MPPAESPLFTTTYSVTEHDAAAVLRSRLFGDWTKSIEPGAALRAVEIRAVRFRHEEVYMATLVVAIDDPNGQRHTDPVVLRRPVVDILTVLVDADTGEEWLALVEEYRPAAGTRCLSNPAGTVDPHETDLDLVAAREQREEVSDAIVFGKPYRLLPAVVGTDKPANVSPGATSEQATFYASRTVLPGDQIQDLGSRTTGLTGEGEFLRLHVVPLNQALWYLGRVWRDSNPDVKTLLSILMYLHARDAGLTYTWEEVAARTGGDPNDLEVRAEALALRPIYLSPDGRATQAALDLLMDEARAEGDAYASGRADAYRDAATAARAVASMDMHRDGLSVVAVGRVDKLAADLENQARVADSDLSTYAARVGDAPDLPTLADVMRSTLNDPGLFDHRDDLGGPIDGVYRTIEPDSVQIQPGDGTYRAILAVHSAVPTPGWTEDQGLGRRTTVGPALRRFELTLTERPRGLEDEGPTPPDGWRTPALHVGEALGLPELEAIIDDVFGGERLVDSIETGSGDEITAGTHLDQDPYYQDDAAGRFLGTLAFVVENGEGYEDDTRPVRRFTLALTEIPRS